MDPETKRELEEIRALAKDNHRMLRAIRRDQWWGFAARIVIWLIVLALPIYLYQQYVAPIIESFTGTTTPATAGFFGFPSPEQIDRAIGAYRGQQ